MKEDRKTGKSTAAELPESQRPDGALKKAITGTAASELAGKGTEATANALIHDHLKRTEQEMAVIAEIGRVIGSTLNIDEVYERFASETRKLIPFDSLNVTLNDPQSDTLKLAYMNGMAIEGRKPGHSIPRVGSLTEELIRTRTGFIVNVTSLEAFSKRFPAATNNYKAGVRSVLCVPLLSGGEVIGGLNFRSKTANAYTERDLSLAQRIGDQIAGAIANAQLYANIKRAEQEMAAIAEISRVIGSTLNIEEVYERFASETRKLIPFDSLIVNLMTEQADHMEIAYVSGIPIPKRDPGRRFFLGGTLAEAVMHTRAGLIIQGLSPKAMLARFPTMQFSIQAGIRSILGVTLISNDQVIGTLMIRSKTAEAYRESDLRLAEKIGAQIAGAMANAQLFANLKRAEGSLRESEEKYRELVEFLPISVFEINPNGKIASFNHTALEMFGYGHDDPIKEMEGGQFIVPGEWKRLTEDMQAVMDGASRSSVEYQFIRKDGSTFMGVIYASPIIRQGKPAGIRGAIIDITDRIKAAEELQKAKAHLLQSEKLIALGRLSAGVAHEILNPVNIISLALQILMKENELPPKAKQKLGICTDQIRRIVTIAEDLKRFSHVKQNRLAVADMAAVVDHVLEFCLPQLKINGIKTEVQHPADLPMTLMDQERLEQVIMNLVTNAAAAMEGKEEKVLRIAIDRGTTAEGKDCLRVTIADTGTGICKQDMTRIFEPFYTTKEPGKGTGLGLSISFSIIEDHGGRIWVENNEWEGASFFFEIPIITNEAGAAFQAKEILHGENSCSR